MKLELRNEWRGNSLKDGGAFPITFLDIYADIHSGYRFFSITILNFALNVDFGGNYTKEQPND